MPHPTAIQAARAIRAAHRDPALARIPRPCRLPIRSSRASPSAAGYADTAQAARLCGAAYAATEFA